MSKQKLYPIHPSEIGSRDKIYQKVKPLKHAA